MIGKLIGTDVDFVDGTREGAILGRIVEIPVGKLVGTDVDFVEIVVGKPEGKKALVGKAEGKALFFGRALDLATLGENSFPLITDVESVRATSALPPVKGITTAEKNLAFIINNAKTKDCILEVT